VTGGHERTGMAFEAGLGLSLPERVPYRLTRDLVDGMGPTGVEGVFRCVRMRPHASAVPLWP
jgi:phosphatidylinositol kinase/protein kinase (PI-3  family)